MCTHLKCTVWFVWYMYILETTTTIKIMKLSITLKSFLLHLSFYPIPVPMSLLPAPLQRNCWSRSPIVSMLLNLIINPQSSLYLTSAAFWLNIFSYLDMISSLGFQDITLDWFSSCLLDALYSSPSHFGITLENPRVHFVVLLSSLSSLTSFIILNQWQG